MGRGEGGGERVHHGAPDVGDRDDAFLFAVHGLREEAEGFVDVGLFLRGDAVLFGELGGARGARGAGVGGGRCWAALGGLGGGNKG